MWNMKVTVCQQLPIGSFSPHNCIVMSTILTGISVVNSHPTRRMTGYNRPYF